MSAKQPTITKPCPQCQQEFTVTARYKKQVRCSLYCKIEAQKAPVAHRKCVRCGTDFATTPKQPTKRFCSNKCSARYRRANVAARFWENVKKTEECWFWTGAKGRHGYGIIMVDGKRIRVHRYSYLLHNESLDNNLGVLHSCDTPLCVNPAHLRLGTNADNVQDKITRNRQSKGEQHGMAILQEPDIPIIQQKLQEGSTFRQIAEEYGVHLSTIHYAATGKNWKHLA